MTFALDYENPALHPINRVESLASNNDWVFDRQGSDEILISVEGVRANYRMSFTWMEDIEALHLACSFDMPLPQGRHSEALALLAIINEQMWLGHFDYWMKDGMVMFRHSLLLNGGLAPTETQVEGLMAHAAKSCDRYYQAFQFTVWGGKSARDAIDCSLFETVGNA
jgi:hypothetical protein